jgi:hypothetical protein
MRRCILGVEYRIALAKDPTATVAEALRGLFWADRDQHSSAAQ